MYLNAHSFFSLRWGTLSPDKLVQEAQKAGIQSLALTDINNTSCAYKFIKACKKYGIKPLLGIEFRKNHKLLYIGVAKNNDGWYELCQLLTRHSMDGSALPVYPPPMQHVFVIYSHAVKPLEDLLEYEFIGVRPSQVNTLYSSPLKTVLHKLVVWSPITFSNRSTYQLHKVLRAIDLNTIVTKLESQDSAAPDEQLVPPVELEQAFTLYPQILENTRRLINACHIDLTRAKENNRQCFTESKVSDALLLEKLAYVGLRKRYGDDHPEARTRLEKELKMIQTLGYSCYFLITWDVIRYAVAQNYYYVGRGSGANSIVAYCLYITDVEPLELDLYFERFINEFRSAPPDFDIDFSWKDRDDVIDYILKRYGEEYTALLATYTTFQRKAAVREVGKALGLPKADIDQIIAEPLATQKHHPWAKHVFRFAACLQKDKFPSHLSIHSGGIIIAQRPLNYFTALKRMPKGFPIVHLDMYAAEELKFHKYDVLSQRGLGHIKDTLALVKKNRGEIVDIRDVENIKNDIRVQAQLKSAQCIGCFYIESPAMRGLLSKLLCNTYVHLVAASSIIRPGVAKSGMMREYIRRFHYPYRTKYLHPVFEEHLKETYGVMVYQEDVLKILYYFAGITLSEADIIRRLMKGWNNKPEQLAELKAKYYRNCTARGYSEELAKEVWRQIRSFSGYFFCKAHSASYAAESFQSLYLKTYYPIEFAVGVINNFGGFYKTEFYFHEAKMSGATLHPPCVNHSDYLTTLFDKDVFVGFIHLKDFRQEVAYQIVSSRNRFGRFKDLENFIHRINISSEQLDILIRIDAFRFCGKSKYELMWEKNQVFNPKIHLNPTGHLFHEPIKNFQLPILEEGPFDHAFDQIELLGFPLSSPFDLIAKAIEGDITASQLKSHINRTVSIIGYYVCKKDVLTSDRKHMNFGTWIDKNGHYFDTTHFERSLKKSPFRGKGCYLIRGKVTVDFEFPSIEVQRMERLYFIPDERWGETVSRITL